MSSSFLRPRFAGTLLASAFFVGALTPTLSLAEQISVRVSHGSDDVEERSNGYLYQYSGDLELTTDRNNVQTVGIRFRDVPIPPGATISNAWLEFETDEVSTGAANLTIQGHDIGNSPAFNNSNKVTSRQRTSAAVSWSPPEWRTVSAKHQTPSLASVVQEIVNQSAWQSGNAMSFIISGSGRRAAESYNGERQNAPLLTVEYLTGAVEPGLISGVVWEDANSNSIRDSGDRLASGVTVRLENCGSGQSDQAVTDISGRYDFEAPPSDCYTISVDAPDGYGFVTGSGSDVDSAGESDTFSLGSDGYVEVDAGIYKFPVGEGGTVDVRISSWRDDVEQRLSGGWMSFYSSDLELGADGSRAQAVGLRFNQIDIPAGAVVTNAYLEFEVDERNSQTTNLVIRGEASANASAFGSARYNLTSRPTTSAQTNWNNVAPWWVVNAKHQSPSIAAVVQEIVSQDGWQAGNSMVFVITGTGERTAESYNGEPAAAPRLVIDYNMAGQPEGLIVVERVSATEDRIVYAGDEPATIFQLDVLYDPAASEVVAREDFTQGNLAQGRDRLTRYRQSSPLQPGTVLAEVHHNQSNSASVTVVNDEVAKGTGEILGSNIELDEDALGDANCDGKTTYVDATVIGLYEVGIPPFSYCSDGKLDPVATDVSCDGEISIVDALLVSRFIWGMQELEACTGTVVGHHWQDNNNNSQEDEGDSNVSGAAVTLENCNTGAQEVVHTDSQGDAVFTSVPVDDCYTLTFAQQSGYEFFTSGDSEVDSSGKTQSFGLLTNDTQAFSAGQREIVVPEKRLSDFRWQKTIRDMGAPGVPGSTEMSSVTINYNRNRMLTISDAGYVYVYDMDSNDEPVESSMKYYRLGNGDWEGITWMYDDVYALVTERTSLVRVVDFSNLDSFAEGSTLPLDRAPMLIARFETDHEVCGGCNGGWEGIAFDPGSIAGSANPNDANWVLYLIDESSTEVFKYQRVGDTLNKLWSQSLEMENMTDGSDLFLSRSTGDLYILSDDTRRVKQYTISGNTLDYVDTVSVYFSGTGLTDPEGIAFSADMSTLYIISEGNSRLGIFR